MKNLLAWLRRGHGIGIYAACVVAGLKSLPGHPLDAYFSSKAADVKPYVAAAPNTP